MDAYLTKPIEAEQLLNTVHRVVADDPPNPAGTGRPADAYAGAGHSPALPALGPALDRHKLGLLEGLGDGRGFVRELANNFIDEAQRIVDDMSHAWQMDDRASLTDQARALMDGAGTIGANPLRDLASDLAATAGNEATQRTGDVARIRSELARVRLELEGYLRRREATGAGP